MIDRTAGYSSTTLSLVDRATITPARFERYLRDYARGTPAKEDIVGGWVRDRDTTNSQNLSRTDVKATRAYSAYQTGFSYSRRARFVQGVATATATDFKSLFA